MRVTPIHLRDGQRFTVGKSVGLWLVWDYKAGTVHDYPTFEMAIAAVDWTLKTERWYNEAHFALLLARPPKFVANPSSIPHVWPLERLTVHDASIPWGWLDGATD